MNYHEIRDLALNKAIDLVNIYLASIRKHEASYSPECLLEFVDLLTMLEIGV